MTKFIYESVEDVLKPKHYNDICKDLDVLFKKMPKPNVKFFKVLKTDLKNDAGTFYRCALVLTRDYEWNVWFYRYFHGTKRWGIDEIYDLNTIKNKKQNLTFHHFDPKYPLNKIHNLDELAKEADELIKKFKQYESWNINHKGSQLFESSLNDTKEAEVLSKQYMDRNVKGDNFTVELFMWSYADEHGLNLEEMDVNEWLSTKEADEWIYYEMESRVYDVIDLFKLDIINDNGDIRIWRKMTVPDSWLEHLEKQGKRLGIYWSWEKDAADTHWGYDNTKSVVTLESIVKENHVDWIETLRANANPSSEEEKEVTLFKNTPLKIERMWINNEEIDISNIKEKIFKA